MMMEQLQRWLPFLVGIGVPSPRGRAWVAVRGRKMLALVPTASSTSDGGAERSKRCRCGVRAE